MNTIHPISHRNYQPAFKGVVDPKVLNLVDAAVRYANKKVAITAQREQKLVNPEVLSSLRETGEIIKKELEKFMAKMHKDSVLTTNKKVLFFKNKKLGQKINIDSDWVKNSEGKGAIISNDLLDLKDPVKYMPKKYSHISVAHEYPVIYRELSGKDLHKLKEFTDTLKANVDPKSLDKAMYAQYYKKLEQQAARNTSFISLLKTLTKSHQMDKIASDFGEPTGVFRRLEKIRRYHGLRQMVQLMARESLESAKKRAEWMD